MRLFLKATGFIVILSLLTVIALVGCGSSPSKGTSNSTSEGNITGKVVAPSNVTFKHLEKMAFLENLSGTVAVSGAICTIEGTDKSAITDEQGAYTITGISGGSYIVICRKTASDGKLFAFLKIAEVRAGITTEIGTVQITQAGNIQGKATLANQSDHIGISVYIPGTSIQARTDATGDYLIKNIPEGPYNLLFEKDGYVTASLDVIVASGETTVANDVSLSLSTGASGSIMIENGKVYTNSRNVTVSIDASEEAVLYQISENPNFIGSVWNPVPSSRSWIFDSDGEKRLYAKFADANGLESSPVSDSITIDTTPPSNGSIIINNGASATNSTTVTLTLSATDAATAVSQRKISNNPDFTDSIWGAFASQVIWTIPSGDGNKTVYVKFRDVAGNETGTVSASIILDAVDTDKPILSDIRVLTTDAAATIIWQTNEPTTGQVDFGLNQDYGSTKTDNNLTTSHTVPLSGLSSRTLYHYRITSIDVVNNTTATTDLSFMTQPASMPTGRSFLGVGVVNGILYAVGGSGKNGYLTTVEAYDPVTNTWTTKAPMPTARSGLGVGVINGILYAVGGHNGTGDIATVEAYDPVTNSWATKAPMPQSLISFGVGVAKNILYATGKYQNLWRVRPDDWSSAYDPVTNTWTPTGPTCHSGYGVGVINDNLYVLGYVFDPRSYPIPGRNEMTFAAYDPVTRNNTNKAPMPISLTYSGIGVVNGTLYSLGGRDYYTGIIQDTIQAYDPVSNTWTTKDPMSTARYGLGVGVINGILYAVGGSNGTVGAPATVEAFIP